MYLLDSFSEHLKWFNQGQQVGEKKVLYKNELTS